MFCSNCGKEITEHARFCAHCGSPVPPVPPSVPSSSEIPAPPIPKKTISPIFTGGIFAVTLTAAVVAGSVFYFTSRNDDAAKETSVSSEKSTKDKDTTEKDSKKKDTSVSDTDDEKDSPAVSKKAKLLRNYLETELIPQYGTADLGAQTREFYYEELYAEDSQIGFWTASAGLSDAKIYDLDQDGDEELLVFLLTEEDITLCIYEAEKGEIRQAAEYTWERYSDLNGCDCSWSLLCIDEIPYLFYYEQGYGIVWDFSTTNAGLYRYDGSHLYSPLVIAQTAGGSSDFIYTAYQYGPEGDLLEEEIIYDETMEYLPNSSREQCYQRIAELFGKYGIHLNSKAALQEGQDIYQGVTDADDYETLLRLEMWGDYLKQDDSYSIMYHFNDFESP